MMQSTNQSVCRNDEDASYQSAVSTNPTGVWFWICDVIVPSGGNNDTGSLLTVQIDYGVRFEGRQNLALS